MDSYFDADETIDVSVIFHSRYASLMYLQDWISWL